MTTIGAIGGASAAWSNMAASRARMQDKMFEKVDADGSGGIDTSELQGLLDDVAEKTGVDAGSDATALLSQLDSNGDGSLGSEELAEGMRSILPPPSTMDFAQARASGSDDLFSKVDADGDGSISEDELQDLVEKIGTHRAGPSAPADATDDAFSRLDSDGDGSLSQAEFDAGRPSSPQGGPAGMPPPPPAGARNDAGASGTSAAYDPLDTNEDGVVSAAERAAGASTEAVQALFDAIDTDGDGTVSQDEGDAFVQQLNAAHESQQTGETSSTASDAAAPEVDLARLLAEAVLRHYDQINQIARDGTAQGSATTLNVVA
jgi:Ca2+-binding EF-hand superfamily protein